MLWRETVGLPLLVGLAAIGVAMNLLAKPFASMLPSVYTLILRGVTIVGIAVALPIAAIHVRAEGIEVGITAFAVALIVYSIVIIAQEPTLPTLVRWVDFPAALLLAFDPGLIERPATAHPLPMACVGVLFSAILIVRAFQPVRSVRGTSAAARAISDLSRDEKEAKVRWFFPGVFPRRDATRPWLHSLADDRLVDWVRAVRYEGRHRLLWLFAQLAMAILLASAVSLDGMVAMAPMLLLLVLSAVPTQLRGGFLYPISRTRRAQVAFWRTIADSLPVCLLTAAALPLLFPLFAPLRLALFHTVQHASPAMMPMAMAVAFSLVPLIQFSWGQSWKPAFQIREQEMYATVRLSSLGELLALGLVLFAAVAMTMWATHADVVRSVLTISALGVAVYSLYWIALRRDAARRDLE
jgi:hypothetical protein